MKSKLANGNCPSFGRPSAKAVDRKAVVQSISRPQEVPFQHVARDRLFNAVPPCMFGAPPYRMGNSARIAGMTVKQRDIERGRFQARDVRVVDHELSETLGPFGEVEAELVRLRFLHACIGIGERLGDKAPRGEQQSV